MIDFGNIIEKLIHADIVKKNDTGGEDLFSIEKDSHHLTPEELELFLHALHGGSTHDDRVCNDLHQFNYGNSLDGF